MLRPTGLYILTVLRWRETNDIAYSVRSMCSIVL